MQPNKREESIFYISDLLNNSASQDSLFLNFIHSTLSKSVLLDLSFQPAGFVTAVMGCGESKWFFGTIERMSLCQLLFKETFIDVLGVTVAVQVQIESFFNWEIRLLLEVGFGIIVIVDRLLHVCNKI